jgi:endonuclease/exonuclease/phosphatase family metal-dependent hydrolase
MQWNVESSEPLDNISAYLADVRPDIICLQELTVTAVGDEQIHAPRQLASQLDLRCAQVEVAATPNDRGVVSIANAIFTNAVVARKRSALLIEPGPEADFENQARAYIEADLVFQRHRVTIGTTHLGYSRRFEMTPRKISEADRLMGQIDAHEHSFVLAGDLNATPRSYTIRRLQEKLVSAGPPLDVPSWTKKPFSYQGFVENALRWRIDYVFATPDVRIARSEMLDPPYSDHRPILISIELPEDSS